MEKIKISKLIAGISFIIIGFLMMALAFIYLV